MSEATAADVIRFLGLSEVAEARSTGEVSFPLGILYPYSRDLQRVCSRYEDLADEDPDTADTLLGGKHRRRGASVEPTTRAVALLAAVAALHSRIAFAPGRSGASVANAYRRVADTTGLARL